MVSGFALLLARCRWMLARVVLMFRYVWRCVVFVLNVESACVYADLLNEVPEPVSMYCVHIYTPNGRT